jgi:hypothetical protein
MDAAAEQFGRHLRELHLRAGKPSYATLERLSQHQLKRATVSDVLNGNRVNLPNWRFVSLFFEACRAAAVDSGLADSQLGTLADWKKHWDSAFAGVIGTRYPGSGRQQAAGRETGAAGPVAAAGAAAAARAAAAVGRADDVTGGTFAGDGPARAEGAGRAATVLSPARPGDEPAAGAGPVARCGPVPGKLPGFAGREAWLSVLRARLSAPDRGTPVVIQGQFGVGKTQLAVEYVHRYADSYDLIWWIPCGTSEAVHEAMAALAAGLGIPAAPEQEENKYSRLHNALCGGQAGPRWLLVFDGAEDPTDIRGLLPPMIPPAAGHVLVTTRNSRWEASGDMLELDVLTRAESVRFLRGEMRRISEADADRLAAAVGDLPLLLEHAVEAQIEAGEYIARLNTDPFRLLDAQPLDYPVTVSAQWRTVIGQLRDNYPDGLELLRCLAFFGSGPVPRDWLERGQYLTGISIRDCLKDPLRLDRAMRALRRSGLLRIRPDVRALEVHPVTRCIVRKVAAREEALDAMRDVRLLLAAADPRDPEDPANWRLYDELRLHAAYARIESCREEVVRPLVINMVRSLTAAGSPRAAISQADRVLRRWTAIGIADDPAGAGALLDIGRAKAAALLACGQYRASLQLQQETLFALLPGAGATAGTGHPSLMTGARHRLLGNFADAQAADREHAARYGREHPQAFLAMNNVISDLALSGDYPTAAREAARVFGACLEFYEDPGSPVVLLEQNALGRCQWLCGKSREAALTLAQVRAGYDAKIEAGEFSENHPWRLASEVDYALAQRDHGPSAAAMGAVTGQLQLARRRCQRALGAGHFQTLAATVALASILRRTSGQSAEAVRWLTEADRLYRSTLPGHPFAFACQGYLAVVRESLTARGPAAGLALSLAELQDAVDGLTRSLSADHPLTLAAVSGLANMLAKAGNLEAALQRGEQALRGFRDRLGTAHPHTLAGEANVATIAARLGRGPGPGDLRERYAEVLGRDHADFQLFTEQRLIIVDFTPLPL